MHGFRFATRRAPFDRRGALASGQKLFHHAVRNPRLKNTASQQLELGDLAGDGFDRALLLLAKCALVLDGKGPLAFRRLDYLAREPP